MAGRRADCQEAVLIPNLAGYRLCTASLMTSLVWCDVLAGEATEAVDPQLMEEVDSAGRMVRLES
jgi:hypothetical protein